MKKNLLKCVTFVFIILICIISLVKLSIPKENNSESEGAKTSSVKKSNPVSFRPYKDPDDIASEGSWNEKSESKAYPKINNKEKNLSIRVSLKGNRVYLLKNKEVVYTMLSTAGIFKGGKSMTPTGTFKIRSNRGETFFNKKLNEGAHNWTSWDPTNVYLFHSVPTKENGKFNIKEANKLGKDQGSHGCIRLSIPDSHWLMKNIPVGTKVVIKND